LPRILRGPVSQGVTTVKDLRDGARSDDTDKL
jgi:hypothetical protein